MSQVIYTTVLNKYTPISWVGKLVYTSSDLIRSTLRTNLGEKYAELFAIPSISSEALRYNENAYWISDYVVNPQPFSKLDAGRQSIVAAQLQDILREILDFAEGIKTDRNRRELGELLTRAIEIPSLDCVWVDNDRITLVLWGFISDEAREKKFNIRKELGEYARPTTRLAVTPPLPPVDQPQRSIATNPSEGNIPSGLSPIPPLSVTLYTQPGLQNPASQTDFVFQFGSQRQTHRSNELGICILSNGPPGEVSVSGTYANKKYQGRFSRVLNQENYIVQLTQKRRVPAWLWWLLLGLLLLLVGWWLWSLFAHPGRAFMPSDPDRLQPIDSTKVRRDPTDPLKRRVVGNRLNLLIDRNVSLEAFADELAARYKPEQISISHYEEEFNLVQVEFADNDLAWWRAALKSIPGVVSVIPESVVNDQQTASLPGNDPGFRNAEAAYHFAVIKAYGAWQQTIGKSDIVVAIVDGGIDIKHPELSSQLRDPFDVYSDTPDIPLYSGDEAGHGTHVSGLVAGKKDNNEGLSGVAPGCRIMPVQVSNPQGILSTMAIIKGFAYAVKHKARVVNLSLGAKLAELASLPINQQEEFAQTQLLDEAQVWQEIYAYARKSGVIVVKAAGNDNVLARMDPMNRSDDIIVVGATDQRNQLAPFSNFGRGVTVSAPGVAIYSSLPNDNYGAMSGTSMAAPIVAGGVAWLLSVNPELTFEQVRDQLIRTGLPVPPDGGRTVGPIIQLSAATPPNDPCGPLIDSLRREIERLKQQPRDSADAMRMPTRPFDCSFAKGDWKSSKNLVNFLSKEKLEVYFQFDGQCAGQIAIKEMTTGNICRSPLSNVTISEKKLILETPTVPCENGSSYDPMRIECQANSNGEAECQTSNNRAGTVKFILYRQQQAL